MKSERELMVTTAHPNIYPTHAIKDLSRAIKKTIKTKPEISQFFVISIIGVFCLKLIKARVPIKPLPYQVNYANTL